MSRSRREKHLHLSCWLKIIIITVVCALLGLRIYQVNKNVAIAPTESYPEGEYVEIGKNYFWSGVEDNTGYEVKVVSATFKKYADFVSEYGETEDYLDEDYRPDFVIDLEVIVRNDNIDEETGRGFDLVDMRIQSSNESFQVHSRLFELLRPDLSGALNFRVRPGTEAAIHLPYTRSISMDGFESDERLFTKNYYLLLSMYPVKKIIELDIKH